MKIAISYPPLESDKGKPLLSQNRQFQWFNESTYIYPMIPACAATLLHKNGYDVIWDDSIAEEKKYGEWLNSIRDVSPDMVVIESKTPVIKRHWKIIDEIKSINQEIIIVLVGDHVTALPKESFENSKVDYILTGGDYDFLLLNLANHLTKKEKLEPGIWYREKGKVKDTGKFQLNHNLNDLPFIDRELTRWRMYSRKNGNYKRTPGTYIMSGRDCWWHKCTFCAWTTLYPQYRVRKPESVLEEIGMLIEKYGVKEIFDDTGAFPIGEWLKKFCNLMIEKGYNKKIYFDCNMRFGALSLDEYKLMKKAGFRMLLFGLESGNQKTLDRINKDLTIEQIKDSCMKAKQAGLEPHITVMLGYPWETKEDALRTVELAEYLFNKGWADTLQATTVISYPGTPLFEECKKNNLLVSEDWDYYDMRKPVMKTPLSESEIKELTQRLYRVFFAPKYMLRKFASVRSVDDLKFAGKGIKKVFGHLKDFSASKSKNLEECD